VVEADVWVKARRLGLQDVHQITLDMLDRVQIVGSVGRSGHQDTDVDVFAHVLIDEVEGLCVRDCAVRQGDPPLSSARRARGSPE
jgi:hypothetical protein